jgi:hypothetical protein
MNRTRGAVLAAAIVAMAGCSTTTGGTGFGPAYSTVAGLGAQIAHGIAQVSTLHGSLKLSVRTAQPGQRLDQTSTFIEQLSGGKVTAIDDRISTAVQGRTTDLRVVYVNRTLYVDHGQNGKPWLLATPDSSDAVAASVARSIQSTLRTSGMQYYTVMVASGHDLGLVGSESVDGDACVHYHLTVDPRAVAEKLPGEQGQEMQQALQAGVDAIPLDLWVDAQGRTVKITDTVAAQGTTADVDLRMNHFNESVEINAPPADQVDQG